MLLNNVDIYACKFFTLTEDKKLKFWSGKFKGKTIDDFTNVQEVKVVIAHCFWMLQFEGIPNISKYTASCFLKSLSSKLVKIEQIHRDKIIKEQERLRIETEELTKTPGTKYV